MKNNKIKFYQDSEFWVNRIVAEYIDEDGQRKIKTKWFKEVGNLDLGSCKNLKNKDVVGFKWVDKNPQSGGINLGDFFGMFK